MGTGFTTPNQGTTGTLESQTVPSAELTASVPPDLSRLNKITKLEVLKNRVPNEYLDDAGHIRDALTAGDIQITQGHESKAIGALKVLLNRLGYYDGGVNGFSTVANQALVDAWKTFKEKCSLGGGPSFGITSYEKLLKEVGGSATALNRPTVSSSPAKIESAIERFTGVEFHTALPGRDERHNRNAEQIQRLNPQATSVA